MGSCIICGTSVDGHICDLHQEDVLFEFRGDHPNQLTNNRYYRGSVDGFAEFGVFVDIGDSVTGLLHRSELDRRLDSLDWDPGDEVFVKVKNVRDNGNIDLGWSIRQDEREFRGVLVDDPEFDHARLADEVDGAGNGSEAAGTDASEDDASQVTVTQSSPPEQSERDDSRQGSTDAGESGQTASTGAADVEDGAVDDTDDERVEQAASAIAESSTGDAASEGASSADDRNGSDVAETATAGGAVVQEREYERVQIGDLEDRVGDDVRLEGEVTNVRQTSGPTVFEVRDETGTVDCAAFVEAGVRAYPEVEEDDVVRLDGEVRDRRGELQVETESLEALEADERETVEERMADALDARARPDAVDPLADDPAIEGLSDSLVEAATAIRKAVITDRPVIVRHSATADGYVAGVAIERATLPLVREEHRRADAEYHYFDRRPLEGGVYDMDDATKDATQMLENRERHDEKVPLFVFVAAGGTRESLDGFELLDVYGAPRVVLDDADADDEVVESVDTILSPALSDSPETTATALAANVAAHVNEDVRADLEHLPAVSFWDDTPEAYLDAAADAGYDADAVRQLREAVALEAFYQSYEDKRELVIDLLFGDDETDVGGLAANIAEQFRTKLDTEVETASANLDVDTVGDVDVAILDTAAFTHGYDFPPSTLLLDELYRQQSDDVDVLVGLDTDTLYVRTDDHVDVHQVAWDVAERVPDAGVSARSAREQSIRFLAGERDDVLDATLDVVAGTQ
ncbi:RecJ-like exonuclease, contains DnaJ-type Zn finger domain [Halomicrobium zhouii]|uniref:RecJ-like exonuclease, contains DnaJ-type Zn finger domain n=1 Tax=Halomicrobium zhouii TaxID=767519 RepID=A0A1I6LXV0_9EURY|nr:OB-fold nucleic acid binding domain-containing protein [Halomicrobium zhouii]SFS08301.1 RecJ-like exonuclease, contains DnaJ-type Zn finger domain [Halomicrobium zhouii]